MLSMTGAALPTGYPGHFPASFVLFLFFSSFFLPFIYSDNPSYRITLYYPKAGVNYHSRYPRTRN
ncbi:hypothetical protein M413DRAFT_270119 [Hebeloma cylindrosporum]|uniref:Uncharacterized protein n=1 Tax=Hebeloma cylindrosporum TaxID=76867 RepID=A0A0C3CEE3_HEBCY|nr:hypothetical protein M413DRAFT_270119 [Hebeloma cylindrosporum h7]